MQKKIISIIKRNSQILTLGLLVIITILFTTYFNYLKTATNKNIINFINNLYLKKTLHSIFDEFEPKYKKVNHKVLRGESFSKIFSKYSIDQKEIDLLKNKLKKIYNVNNLTPNKNLEFTIDQSKKKILDFSFPISLTKKIVLKRDGEQDNFIEKIVTTKLTKKIMYKENIISSSLYRSASESEIPANLIIEFARIYGFQIDFQRDIRKKDYFQIMYEVYLDDDKKVIESGEILFANLNLSGKNNNLYFYKDSKNQGHYDAVGRSIVKTLMKTPINGARLSSKFGMRKHPIDGFNKMHRGTDFAAPLGTPIMASGDGTIIKVGWCGGGGNCVKIKHNSTYQTVYAHMSKFASRIKSGTRVKQGQIIGYVGSTGKSTGPHLHYEVIQNGKRINSQTLKMPSGKVLKGNDRKLFETQKIKLDVLKSEKIMGIS
jgi:murein DD-endopeptidase MepM/ murein hydrolase activator NlpD